MFDFSNYSAKSKNYDDSNKLVFDKMKDETGHVEIKPKNGISKSFYHGKLKTRLSICNLCWHFLTCFF